MAEGRPSRTQLNAVKMTAFHGKTEIKAFYVARVRGHLEADEIVHGRYWEKGRGCSIGCTIHGSNHASFETDLGIPRIVARLEDRIFEGMAAGDSQEFPLQFLTAIPVGADLSRVAARFMLWMLADPEQGVIRFASTERTQAAVTGVAALYERVLKGDTPSEEAWNKARRAADAYLYAAAAAAADAACAASAADAYRYAADAADAYAAAYAAAYLYADVDDHAAAYAAAYLYADAAAYAAAYLYARQNAYRQMRNKLLQLLSEAPVVEAVAAAAARGVE